MFQHFKEYQGVEIEIDDLDGSFRANINGIITKRKDLKAMQREIIQRSGADGLVRVMDQNGSVFDVIRIEGSSIRTKDAVGESAYEFTERRDWNGKMLFQMDQAHVDAVEKQRKLVAEREAAVIQAKKQLTDLIRAYREDESHKFYTRDALRNMLLASRYVARAEKGETQ